MKSVLISIQPKWCALIASGAKTVEVRKTKPKLETPFKCYIYCTKGDWLTSINSKVQKPNNMVIDLTVDNKIQELNGKVIGEFVCDEIYDCRDVNMDDTCITVEEWLKYTKGHEGIVYGWHISDLVIYDEPKELSEFWSADKCPYASKDGCTYKYHCFRAGQTKRCGDTLTRPPQSWCYVEEWLEKPSKSEDE